MTTLLTRNIATMTEMREPHKVLKRSGGEPVAILRNSALVGYFVPAEAISNVQHRSASIEEIRHSLKSRKSITQPVLDYLKDK
ncbi:MAG: antitoxin StbD [Patiriisocius sp.]|jgi:antitoxin StbD